MPTDLPPAQTEPPAPPGMPLGLAADLQDHLMVATNDLDRLQQLLGDAGASLLGHFHGASGQLEHLLRQAAGATPAGDGPLRAAKSHLAAAVTAMQFQDMASQLIAHTARRLRSCADLVARDAMGDDDDGETVVEPAPTLPNPVTQDEMDAGSVELF